MRNYVIINGINSLTIQGLAINNLPPITKPMIRTQREEIDGRDGDIVTELGYSAYDKQMEIGLYGNFDIDSIIKYFTGEGTIVFSNEADKYYNFKILDQIDYEKLLKFKTAVVTFHCQPFKYPLEEEPEEAEITTITGTGESITLENVEEAPMQIVYKGNTYQNGEPTPDTPIPVQVVSGDNSIDVVGTNLYNTNDITNSSISVDNEGYITISIDNSSGSSTILNNFSTSLNSLIKPSTSYSVILEVKSVSGTGRITLNGTSTATQFLGVASRTFESISSNSVYINVTSTRSDFSSANKQFNSYVYCTAGEAGTIKFRVSILSNTSITANDFVYQPYTGASYPINLPEGMELCKIGDYQDKIDKSSGKNLYDRANATENRALNWGTGEEFGETGSITSDFIRTTKGDKFTITFSSQILFYDSNKEYLGCLQSGGETIAKTTGNTWKDFTTPNVDEIYYVKIGTRASADGGVDKLNANIMLNKGYVVIPYEPYGTGWYLKKKIGKVVLNGSENWTYVNSSFRHKVANLNTTGNDVIKQVSNYYKAIKYSSNWSNYDYFVCYTLDGNVVLKNKDITNINDFKTWLSTHNTEVYYVLANPTYTPIEGELLNQLEAIKMSYEGQTNISQTNNDMPFELDASVTFLTPMEINNIGNIYAKPILTIEGTGNIGVVLNDIQILDIDLSNNGKITIDVPKLEAYDPDDDSLLNRLVTGDYMKLLINEGDNKITFTGEVSGATLTNYIRWI